MKKMPLRWKYNRNESYFSISKENLKVNTYSFLKYHHIKFSYFGETVHFIWLELNVLFWLDDEFELREKMGGGLYKGITHTKELQRFISI